MFRKILIFWLFIIAPSILIKPGTAFGLFFKDYCGESKYGSESCGEVMNSRILGGRNARKFEFPWQVLLAICNQTICTECSGSIINKKDVLTAAHCFNIPNIRYIKVSVALLDRRWLTRYTRHYRSSKYVIHEKYDPYTLMNDIAIVHVPVKIRFNPGVQSICLPNKIMSSSFNGKTATVSGWGNVMEKNSINSNILKYAKVEVIPNTSVNCTNGALGIAPKNYLCAYREGVDACQGDSGGPLITQVNGKCSLIGVISGGVGCGRIGFAGLYTRVTEYVDWISEKGKELDEESEESLMEPLISVMVHLKDLFFDKSL